MVYKTLHRKLNIEQHEPHLKPGVNSGAPKNHFFPPFEYLYVKICEEELYLKAKLF